MTAIDRENGAKEVQQLVRDGGAGLALERLTEDYQKMAPAQWNDFAKKFTDLSKAESSLPQFEIVDRNKDGKGDLQDIDPSTGKVDLKFDPKKAVDTYWSGLQRTSIINEKARKVGSNGVHTSSVEQRP
jgi:hypothetical protein